MQPEDTASQQTAEQTVIYCRVDTDLDLTTESLVDEINEGFLSFYPSEESAREDSSAIDLVLYRVVFEKIDTIPADLDEDDDSDSDSEDEDEE